MFNVQMTLGTPVPGPTKPCTAIAAVGIVGGIALDPALGVSAVVSAWGGRALVGLSIATFGYCNQ